MECVAFKPSARTLHSFSQEAVSALRKGLGKPQLARPLRTLQVRAVSTEPVGTGRRARREQNVEGEFYVDRTCIDCDTCRWMTPDVFARVDGQSAVYKQPSTPEERTRSLQALVSCPTGSIRTVTPAKDVLAAQDTFPLPIDPSLPGVYHCGYHSEKSFACTTYFIQREGGNILVDSPRYNERLAKRLEELGGVQYLFLTHRDDVADHKRWQKRLNCTRILHSVEVNADTEEVEMKLEGQGPWALGTDIDLIFTPGHTEAHVALLLKDRETLFSGDHLGATMKNELFIDTVHNWYSVKLQKESMTMLKDYNFKWILPGHGRRYKFESIEEKNATLDKIVDECRDGRSYN